MYLSIKSLLPKTTSRQFQHPVPFNRSFKPRKLQLSSSILFFSSRFVIFQLAMATAIETTTWPAIPIPTDVKDLISRYYSLVETKDSSVGDRLATDVFTPDGIFSSPHVTAAGSAGEYSSFLLYILPNIFRSKNINLSTTGYRNC